MPPMNTNRPSFRLQGTLLWLWLAFSSAAQEAPRPFVFEADVKTPMRDGVNLAANIFRPNGAGPFPVILMRTPYGKMDEKMGDGKRYTAAGCAMVVQDCRGRGKSEGVWDPFRYDVRTAMTRRNGSATKPGATAASAPPAVPM